MESGEQAVVCILGFLSEIRRGRKITGSMRKDYGIELLLA